MAQTARREHAALAQALFLSRARPARALLMRCHYEVLGVSREADGDEIKKAYRRLALQWHPDKNRSEGAEETFRSIQSAYETLSEPKERAWYDGHREAILREDEAPPGGYGDGGEGCGYSAPPDEFDLMGFFRASCYSGYGDTGKGFYCVYGEVFSKLAAQEARAAEAAGREWVQPPAFQGPEAPYSPLVAAFYDFWLSFATLKQFEWVDGYNPMHDGSSRKLRRLMEEDNRKRRRTAQREHNDTVRALADFVRKRDKRYMEHARAAEAAKTARAVELEARRAAEKEAKRAQAAAFRKQADEEAEADPDWMVEALAAERAAANRGRKQGESVGADGDEGDDNGSDGGEARELYCPVCRKRFKSEKQWVNHEQSRKHLDAVAALRWQLRKEEAAAGGGGDGEEGGGEGSEEEGMPDAREAASAKAASKASKKKAAKAAKRFGATAATEPATSSDNEVGGADDAQLAQEVQAKASVADGPEKPAAAVDAEKEEEDEFADAAERFEEEAHAAEEADEQEESEDDQRAEGRSGARKRQEGKGKAAAVEPEGDATCELCGASHESRSALFRHLKEKHQLRSKA